MTRNIVVGLLSLICLMPAMAEAIKVGLEPFPPLIVDVNTGHTVKILKALEVVSDLRFEIEILPYNRAKADLKSGKLDLMGHTPYKVETKDFYEYAQELDFKIDVKNDLYVMDKKKFDDVSKMKIGVPRGNEEFAAELLGLPIKNFQGGALENLLQMLESGRIDGFWFERASTMETLKKLNIKNVLYMEYPKQQLQAGLAVQNSKKGSELKAKLDKLLGNVDQKQLLGGFTAFSRMPPQGVVNPTNK